MREKLIKRWRKDSLTLTMHFLQYTLSQLQKKSKWKEMRFLMAMEQHNIEYPEELQFLLENILGSSNVYFQPPGDIKLSYPCIVYQLDYIRSRFANNFPYGHDKRYSVTFISKTPDQYIPDKIGNLPTCSFSRFYVSDNLNHYSYKLYFDAKPNN